VTVLLLRPDPAAAAAAAVVLCRAKFSGLIAIRQAHGFLFGKSDISSCCGLTLLLLLLLCSAGPSSVG
jgi:hypothetical protein